MKRKMVFLGWVVVLMVVTADVHAGLGPIFIGLVSETETSVPAEGAWGGPLHLAAEQCNTEYLKYLLQAENFTPADLSATDQHFFQPLHVAAMSGCLPAVAMLIANGADLEAKTDEGVTPLLAAAFKGEWLAIEALLLKGADLNATDSIGQTALHFAVMGGDVETVDYLLMKGVDVKVKNNGLAPKRTKCQNMTLVGCQDENDLFWQYYNWGGWSPLHLAVYLGEIQICEMLIKKGADPKEDTTFGQSLLDIAHKQNDQRMIEFLNKY